MGCASPGVAPSTVYVSVTDNEPVKGMDVSLIRDIQTGVDDQSLAATVVDLFGDATGSTATPSMASSSGSSQSRTVASLEYGSRAAAARRRVTVSPWARFTTSPLNTRTAGTRSPSDRRRRSSRGHRS